MSVYIPDSPFSASAALQLALLAARTKDYAGALLALKPWREIDPADSMLRFEATELGHEDEVLWMHLGADTERVLPRIYFTAPFYGRPQT